MNGNVIIDGMCGAGKTTLALDLIKANTCKKKVVIGMIEASTAIMEDDVRIVTADKLKDVKEFKTLIVNPIQKCHYIPEEEEMIYSFMKEHIDDGDILFVVDEAPNVLSAHLIDFILAETTDVCKIHVCKKIIVCQTQEQLLNGEISKDRLKELLTRWARIHVER